MTWRFLRAFSLATALAFSSVSLSALAQSGNHGDGHAQGHETYKEWKAPGGSSCCNERTTDSDGNVTGDCRPVRARQDEDGNWEAWVSEYRQWIKVPADRVLGPSEDGRSHLCELQGFVYCFKYGEVRS